MRPFWKSRALISWTFPMIYREDEPQAPEGYPYQACIYGAARIKEQVSVPVFAVNSIVTPQMARRSFRPRRWTWWICAGR